MNLNKGVQAQTVWDTYKAVMRGTLMELNTNDKRKKQENYQEIQASIKQKEIVLKK